MSQTSDARGLTVENSGNAGKSADYEEAATLDEDIEARLYAEIYYSNENYQQNCESPTQNRVEAAGENFAVDSRPGAAADGSANEQQRPYPSRSWVLGEGSNNAGFGKSQPVKRQRLLAYKGLWLPRVEPPETRINRQEFQSAGSSGSLSAAAAENAVFGAVGNRRDTEDFGSLGSRRETGIFGTVGGGNEAGNFSPVGNRNATNFSPVGNRNATEHFSPAGNRNATENFSPAGNRNATNSSPAGNRNATNFSPAGNRNATENFSPAGNCNATNFSPAGNRNATNFSPAGNRNVTENFSPAGNRNATENFSPVGSREEAANFVAVEGHKEAANFSPATAGGRRKAANFAAAGGRNETATFGAAGSLNQPPVFGAFTDRTRVTDFKSVEKRSNASVVRSTAVPGHCFPRFVDDDNEAENIWPIPDRFRGSRNNRLRFPSRPIESENVGPAADPLEAENNFARLAIEPNNPSAIANCLGRVDANFPRFASEAISENPSRVVNPFHEPASNFIRLVPVGRRRERNRERNDFSWFGGAAIETGSDVRNSPSRRKKAADNSARFVADFLEANEDSADARLASYVEDADPQDDAITFDCSRILAEAETVRQNQLRAQRRENRLLKRQQLRKERKRKQREKMRSKGPKNPAESVDRSTSSKYKVVSKRSKLDEQLSKLNEPEPVDISSDSDDSILEVPVPPKAPPPVIQLQDSDDEGDRQSPSKNRQKSAAEPSDSSSPTPEEAESADNSAAPAERDENAGKSAKNRRKSAQETSESSSKIPETDRSDDSAAIASVPQECDGKSARNRQKKGKKSAGETPRRESAASSGGSENESTQIEASGAQSVFSPRVTREAAKKSRKSKKSADESREDSAVDFAADGGSAVQIGEIGTPISPRVARSAAKDAKSAENSTAISSVPQDSDEEIGSGKSGKNRPKKGKKSADEPREELPAPCAAETDFSGDRSEIGEAKLQKMLRDSAKKAKESAARLPISSPEDGGLILNCTEIQKGASSLEEIRKMREMALPISHAHSDDSMTESEANNWGNIAAGQARNSSRVDEEICSVSSSIEPASSALWEDRSTPVNRLESSAEIVEKSVESSTPIAGIATTPGTSGPIDVEAENPRKRQKDTRPFVDFDVPAIPEKRPKQNRQKTSREQTMTEYFFKPMSKELQAFYNNPWGGENLDVYDLQSRMPRNPNHWAILDADLQGPASKRRKLCPRCKTDSHFGKRCPEKAKAPCCYMCGAKGHTETRCPHTMCLTCGRKYATYRPTCGFCSQLYCTMCNGAGHSCENCPDLWRRYHNTTTDTLPMIPRDAASVMKPAQSLTCCNCARRGHDATTCRQLRWSQHFPTPTYVTSYTEGPTYEPATPGVPFVNDLRYTHHPPAEPAANRRFANAYDQQTGDFASDFTSDFASDFPGEFTHDQPADAFTSAEMFYESREPTENAEIIEIPDVATENSPAEQRRIIFQVSEGKIQKFATWPGATRRLDTIPKIELTGLLAGTQTPNFLNEWKKKIPFHLLIFEDAGGAIFLDMRCRTRAILKEFERVVFQWLERSDAEKAYLVYKNIPFGPSKKSTEELRTKLLMLRTVLKPLNLLRKINACDRTVRQTNANLGTKTSLTKRDRRRLTALKTTSEFSMSRRCQLVTALYGGAWVAGGNAKLRVFRKLAREREKLAEIGKVLAPADFLSLVYLYNEIFAFHESEALKQALAKVVAAATPEELALVKDECVFPRAEFLEVPGGSEGVDAAPDSAELPEGLATNSAGSSADFEENFAGSSRNLEDSPANLNSVEDSPNEPPFPVPRDEVVSRDFGANPATISRQPSGNVTYVAALKKKRRKSYRNKANTAIKAALAAGSQKVQSMANALRAKLRDTTATTGDVDELDRVLGCDRRLRKFKGIVVAAEQEKTKKRRAKLRQRREARAEQQQQPQQQPQQLQQPPCTWEISPTYVNFLRTL